MTETVRGLDPIPRRNAIVLLLAVYAGLIAGASGQPNDPQAQPTPIREYQDEGWKVRIYRNEDWRPEPRPTPPAEAFPQFQPDEPIPGVPTATPVPTPTPDPATVTVAAVDGRRLTRLELNRRVQGPMKKVRSLLKVEPDTPEYQVHLNRQEGRLVEDWVDRVLLAEEARRRGIMLSQSEFDERFDQLMNSPEGQEDVETALGALGLTEEELKSSLYEALLGEKVVEQALDAYDDEYLRALYDKAPKAFFRPAQVHVLHFSQALEGNEGVGELRELKKTLDRIQGRIAKGESPSAIAEEQGGLLLGAVGLDLGWISPTIQSLPLEVQKAVADLKPGQTSKVILSRDDAGRPLAFHVVKVLEARPAAGDSFETARPLLRESLREGVRDRVLLDLKESGKHRVIVNLSGIRKEILEGKPIDRAWNAVRQRDVDSNRSDTSRTSPVPAEERASEP
jgi:parvulin-like peptidyl-prolyl isomerase